MDKQPSETLHTFGQLLAVLEHGELDAELAREIQELMADLNNASAEQSATVKGSLTLTLNFAMRDGIVDVVAQVKTKPPTAPRGRTVMWTTPENRLTRANPNQREMFADVNKLPRTRDV